MCNSVGGLYFIRDLISGLRITSYLEFPNDVVAVKSFVAFLEDKKSDAKFYELTLLCRVSDEDVVIDSGMRVVVRGSDASDLLEKMLEPYEEGADV